MTPRDPASSKLSAFVRKLARPLFERAEAAQRQHMHRSLGIERLEQRELLAFAITGPANGILTITNDGNAEMCDFVHNNVGNIYFINSGGAAINIAGATGAAATAPAGGFAFAVNVPDAGIQRVDFVAGAADFAVGVRLAGGGLENPPFNNLSLATAGDLREIRYRGNAGVDNLEFRHANNPNIYFDLDLGAGIGQSLIVDEEAVTVIRFGDVAAASSATVTTESPMTRAALDFSAVTANVNANLNVPVGGLLATWSSGANTMSVNLAAASNANEISGVHGGTGDDTLIANANGNLLIGGLGNDTLIGGAGNDQLNATFDFSPAFAGNNNTANLAALGANSLRGLLGPNTVIDLAASQMLIGQYTPAIQTAIQGPGGVASAALFGKFAPFNFGRGQGFVEADGVWTNDDFGEDFALANNVVPATNSSDLLIGGAGDDGLYGFNATSVTAQGQGGTDVMSTNTGGLASSYDGGDQDDLIIGSNGSTVQGGSGNDTINWVNNPANTALSRAVGGTGNDTLNLDGILNIVIDASEGNDTVRMNNDSTISLLFNNSTVFTLLPVNALGSVQKIKRS